MTSDTPKPPALTESVTLRLISLGRVFERRFGVELERQGLTMRHLGALGHLARNPDMSYSDLARRSHVTSQSMNVTVRALEDSGAVRRTLVGHGHAARLEITTKGQQLLDGARESASELDGLILGEMSSEEVTLVMDVLERLTSTVRLGALDKISHGRDVINWGRHLT